MLGEGLEPLTPHSKNTARERGLPRRARILWFALDSAARSTLGSAYRGTPYEVVESSDMEAVPDLFVAMVPDLLILECGSAGQAVSLCHRVRSLRDPDWQPVVAVVSGDEEGFAVALEGGFDDLWERPLDPRWVRRHTRLLLSRGQTERTLKERVASQSSELEQARRGLDERRRFTETLLDQITTCVVTADLGGRVSFANRMAQETLGATASDCLGRDVAGLFHRNDEVVATLRAVADGGERRVEFSLDGADGRTLEVGMTVMRVSRTAPPDMTFVLIFRDLAHVRQFEMELRRVERLSAIGNMVAGFAHEVRNPLGGIQALAEALLAETSADDDRREYVRRMLLLLARVERFVKASLEFGEPRLPRKRSLDPSVVLGLALEALGPRWGRRGSPPDTKIDPDLPSVQADQGQIAECLLALLENALDAAGDTTRVRVHLYAEAAGDLIPSAARLIRFDIEDDGPGIPDNQLSRIFDPFYTTKPKGTGLGLSVAQTLVRENGGRLIVRSTPGTSTVFSLILPEAAS